MCKLILVYKGFDGHGAYSAICNDPGNTHVWGNDMTHFFKFSGAVLLEEDCQDGHIGFLDGRI